MGTVAVRRLSWLLPLLYVPAGAYAHGAADSVGGAWRMTWWIAALLAATVLMYARGLLALWRQSGPARGIGRAQAGAFAAGWLVTLAALAPPIDALGQRLFSMHMVQHELLMVVAAPLLVLGRPFVAWSWAWPRAAQRVHHVFTRPPLAALWRGMTDPLGAWLLHAVALWLWHAPRLFEAALVNDGLHELQHASFFATALLFWWSLTDRGRAVRMHGVALLSLFTTMLHTGVLGALLTLSPQAWYPLYGPTTQALGLDPLADQHLGGLLMWIPAGAAYLVAALVVAARLLAAPAALRR